MIIIRNKYFSERKLKSDKETKRQKEDRRGSSVTSGLVVGGTSGLLANSIIDNKINKGEAKIYEQTKKHLDIIDIEKTRVDRNIDQKVKEILNNPRIRKEGKVGAEKVRMTAENLKQQNARRGIKKIEKLDAAQKRLLNRLKIKGVKARLAAGLGATVIGVGTGIATNNAIKKNNKKINRIRRHIED